MNPETSVLPWEILLNNAAWFIDDLPDGGKRVKLVPLAVAMTPQGTQQVPVGTAVTIVFGEDGWERFQRDIAAGEKSKVIVAQPGNGLNGNGGQPH